MKAFKHLLMVVLAAGTLVGIAPARAEFISFVVSVTNLSTSPTNFLFSFATPITPLTGLVSYTGTLSANVVEDGDGVTVSPYLGSFLGMGVNNLANPPIATDTLPAFNADFGPTLVFSGIYDCTAGCSSLFALLHFTVSGLDGVSFAGEVTLNPLSVPEPGSLLLLGVAVGALALARRRQRTAP